MLKRFRLVVQLVTGAALVSACATLRPLSPVFEHLQVQGRVIRTTHGVPLRVEAPETFRIAGPTNRVADFGGHPYQVSLAAFLEPERAIMVHAEQVMDRSGASNYDDLPTAVWPSPQFRERSYCADVTPALVAQEHDLKWLARNGFDPIGPLAVRQYLRTSSAYDREAVLSLVVRGVGCADKTSLDDAFARLQQQVRVGEAAQSRSSPRLVANSARADTPDAELFLRNR